jgi:hypothetical protein
MIRVLEIIASSWPIAIMFIASMAACIAFYLIRWFKKADQDDKAYRASQAIVVRRSDDG